MGTSSEDGEMDDIRIARFLAESAELVKILVIVSSHETKIPVQNRRSTKNLQRSQKLSQDIQWDNGQREHPSTGSKFCGDSKYYDEAYGKRSTRITKAL